jgi:hypothetical protein
MSTRVPFKWLRSAPQTSHCCFRMGTTRIFSGFFPLFYSVSVACQDDLLLIRQRRDVLAKDGHVAGLENRLN